MAYESWLTPTPLSGKGNGSISNTAANHTGRSNRTTIVTVTPSVGNAKTYTVNQSAAPEFITVSETASVAAVATSYSVSGTSNTTKIKWATTTPGTLSPTVPASYTANGNTATNNEAIPGDPGATSQFNFSGNVTFSANPTIVARTGTITLTAGGGTEGLVKNIVITQKAGESTLSIDPVKATYITAGEGKGVAVTTNSTWTASSSVNWLSASPSTGGAIKTTITATEHTGRLDRTGKTTFTVTAGGKKTADFTATQTGKPQFLTWASKIYTATKKGGTVTMTGTSNASLIKFSIKNGGESIASVPVSYTANSIPTANSAEIDGDPGATAQFSFSINITVNPNLTIDARSVTVVANEVEAVINQAAGDAVLDVSPTSITLPAAGTPAVSVSVTSNTSWTVS